MIQATSGMAHEIMVRFKFSYLFFVFTLASHWCSGQQLYMEKYFGGARFSTDSLSVSTRQVLFIVQDNRTAYNEFRHARRQSGIASALGFAGGVLIALPVVTAAIGGKPEWTIAAAGGTLVIVSIPFGRSFRRHAENALETYNMKYQTGRLVPRLYLNATGARLVIRF